MGMRDKAISCGTHRPTRIGQVSLEYLLVIGFSFVLLVPLMLLYLGTQSDTREAIGHGQTTRVAETLRDAAERVYVAGAPARETIVVKIPEGIASVALDNTTILYTMNARGGPYTIAINGFAPLSGVIPIRAGTHSVVVTAVGAGVVFS